MGLDILKYSKEGKRIGMGEFDEELHQIIFRSTSIDWEEFNYLNLINDYYKTDLAIKGESLSSFIIELKNIYNYVPKQIRFKLDQLINDISSEDIYHIRITGD